MIHVFASSLNWNMDSLLEVYADSIRPPCFDRAPAANDSYFRYDEFEAFALSSRALNEAWKLHIPRELISHDVTEEDW